MFWLDVKFTSLVKLILPAVWFSIVSPAPIVVFWAVMFGVLTKRAGWLLPVEFSRDMITPVLFSMRAPMVLFSVWVLITRVLLEFSIRMPVVKFVIVHPCIRILSFPDVVSPVPVPPPVMLLPSPSSSHRRLIPLFPIVGPLLPVNITCPRIVEFLLSWHEQLASCSLLMMIMSVRSSSWTVPFTTVTLVAFDAIMVAFEIELPWVILVPPPAPADAVVSIASLSSIIDPVKLHLVMFDPRAVPLMTITLLPIDLFIVELEMNDPSVSMDLITLEFHTELELTSESIT